MNLQVGDPVMVRHLFGGEPCPGRVTGRTTGGVFVQYLSGSLLLEHAMFPDGEAVPLALKWPEKAKAKPRAAAAAE